MIYNDILCQCIVYNYILYNDIIYNYILYNYIIRNYIQCKDIVSAVTYGAETWGLREAERRRLNVFEMKNLRPMVGVTRWDRINNEEIRRRAGIEETLEDKID